MNANLRAALLLAVVPAAASAQTIAIIGGTVYPVSGPKIPNGTVLFRDGLITAVGSSVAIPADAVRVDATGKWVTPGFIHANANAGLGVARLGSFRESAVQGDVNPAFNPAEAIDPGAFDIPIARTGGITSAILGPNGTLLPGQAVAVNYAGERIEDMIAVRNAALVLDLTDNSKPAGGGSRAGTMARIRRLFADAVEYARRKADYRRAAMQPLSAAPAELDALLPALGGKEPVVVIADRRMDIENALRLKREYNLHLILSSAVEGWQLATEIANAKVPVALEPLHDIPSFDGLGARLDNATLLRAAGVEVIIAQADPGGERNLRYAAGNAVAHGMTWDDALRAVTALPAEHFGMPGYGVLAPGKVANVVVWSGDPFDFASAAERVYIRGAETSLRTRENDLRDKYRTLPPGN